ncbi:Ubiquitin conjugation factor [Venturia nashicola]|uniref:Ubiquitin conjugation factor n=1 Tax=Venturia nashicola TaxID=86259 RepID=A0A4Z1NJI5_9PEZI|nr:Ubiquitin conjugation factor [Venturia nashicola]
MSGPGVDAANKSRKRNKKKKGGNTGKAEGMNGDSEAVTGTNGNASEEEGEGPVEPISEVEDEELETQQTKLPIPPASNSNPTPVPQSSVKTNGVKMDSSTDTSERLDALARERDALRTEVSELRQSLEAVRSKHEEEVGGLQEQLEETQTGKEHAETQYQELLGRVTTIRTQLGERLKAYAEEVAQANSHIEDLEEQNRTAQEKNESLQEDHEKLKNEHEQQSREVETLRSRTNLSQQNWLKEREELIQREAFAREEFETAKQAMQDWEVLAMEERSLRESLSEKVSELEDQLSNQRESYERAAAERDTQSQAVDGLQRALRDIQDARKKELRELVENSQSQLESLRKQLQTAEETSSTTQAELQAAQKELTRAMSFEKEVKEKSLLIGKLKHEAVILNDHLTKALRFLKQRKPEDMVDRQLVTNHFLQFISMDRADPKKFQVLQLISALLSWSDEQKEQAGLARPGAPTSSTLSSTLRLPSSPFRKTPSTPSLGTQLDNSTSTSTSKESLAELWSDFLEREAQEGKSGSRRPSTATQGSHTPTLERKGSGFS